MPDLGFKDQFAAGVLDGSKPFTLRRAWKHGRTPGVGTMVGIVTGWRTPQRKRVGWARVDFRCTVRFNALGVTDMFEWSQVDRLTTSGERVRQVLADAAALSRMPLPDSQDLAAANFAALDGFDTWSDFWRFHSKYRSADAPSVCERELIGFGQVTREFQEV